MAEKIESLKEPALIWKLLEQEDLTSERSGFVTKHFTVDELNGHFCSVAIAHRPCTTTCLQHIIETIPFTVQIAFSFSEVTEAEDLA